MMMTLFMPPHAHTINNNSKVIIWFVSALTLSVLITNVHPATIKKREIPLNPQQKVGEIPIVHIVNNTIISKLTKTDPDIGEENEGKYQIVTVDTAETTHSNVSESNEDNKQLNLSRITIEKLNHEAAFNIETTTTTTTSANSNFSIAELSVNDINAKYEKEEKVKHNNNNNNNNNHVVNRPTGATEEINDSKTALKIFDHDLLQLLGAEDKKEEDLEVTENALKIINETYKNSITSSLTEKVTGKPDAQPPAHFDSSTERSEQDEKLITTQERPIDHTQPPIAKEEFYRKGKKAWLDSSSIAETLSTEVSFRKGTISTESPFFDPGRIETSTVTLSKGTFTTNRQEQEHGQSLSTTAATTTTTTTATTTFNNINENEILTTTTAKITSNPFTTLKSFIKSITDSDVERNVEIKMPSSSSSPSILNSEEINEVRVSSAEKKAKFINNNSTNAQQLNLPNASAVWSLVGMKTVAKSNDTIATSKQSPKANNERNFNETLTNNGNSEKTLLDWTQIMANKDLVTSRVNQGPNTAANDIDSTEEITEDSTVESINTAEKKHLSNNEIFLDETTTTTTIASNISKELMISPNITEQQIAFVPTPANVQSPLANVTTILSTIDNESTQETPATVTTQTITEAADTAQTITSTAQPMSDETTTFKYAINMPTALPNYLDTQSPPTFNESLTLTANRSVTTQNNDEHYFIKTNNVDAVTDYHANASASVDDAVTTAVNVDVGQASSETTTFSTLIDDELNASISHIPSVYTVTTVIPRHSFVNSIEEETTIITIEDDETYTTPTFLSTNDSTLINGQRWQKTEIDSNGNEINLEESNNKNDSSTIKTHLISKVFETATTTTTTTTIGTTAITPSKETLTEHTTSSTSAETETILNNQLVEQNKGEVKENSTTSTTTTAIIESTPKADVTLASPTVLTITANIANSTTSTLPLSVMSEEISETKTSVTEITPVASGTLRPSSESSIETNAIEVLDKNNTNVKDKTKQINIAEIKTNETKSEKKLEYETEQPEKGSHNKLFITRKTAAAATTTTTTPAIRTINTTMSTNTTTEETLISLLDDYSTTTSAAIATTTTTTTTIATMMTPTTTTATTATPVNIATKVEDIYKVIHNPTTETPQATTILQIPAARTPIIATTPSTQITTTTSIYPPKVVVPTLATTVMGNANTGGGGGHLYTKTSESPAETDVNVIIAITVSVIGVVALILLVAFLYLMRKRQKSSSYSQRCRPVSLDDYTIDNTSVYNSMRLKGAALRSSKRSHANLAFDDPSLRHNALSTIELARFVQEKSNIYEEFRDVPQVTARPDEVPVGCEDKNRYANVVPLPETRVLLQRLNDDVRTEYINANYVRGPKDSPKYYIACQAPLDSTVEDFWRMIWEQQSRVIIQATDLIESGVEKCAEYLPPSVTLDNHSTFGDFQVTLQNREIKDKYAISTIQLKRTGENVTRELTHYWYKWPETGVPAEEAPIIAMLLEARSSLISYAIEQANEMKEKSSTLTLRSTEEISSANSTTSAGKDSNGSTGNTREINGNISMVHIKKTARNQGPLTVHCSPGTGRTGTIIACDIAIRSLEMPKRAVDIPQIVYYVRHGRASAVRTKEQYEFIYKVANMYATKITNPSNDN